MEFRNTNLRTIASGNDEAIKMGMMPKNDIGTYTTHTNKNNDGNNLEWGRAQR